MTLLSLFHVHTEKRVFGLDLLRAFAIFMVMALHSAIWVTPRFTWYHEFVRHYDGVGIFFVLSGFLIGGILIKILETKGLAFRNLWDFWVRRWMRTVPLYMLVLCLVIPIEGLNGTQAATYIPYFFFLQNFNWPIPFAFLESWSLTVEEWFYLLSAPTTFLFAKALKPRVGVVVTAAVFLLASTLYRYYCFQSAPPVNLKEWDAHFRSIVLLRLDSLMYGVLAAWISYYYPSIWNRSKIILFVLGFGALSMVTLPDKSTSLNIFTCVFSFSSVSLSVAFTLPLLSNWKSASGSAAYVVTHISLISYSLYLLHATIINANLAVKTVHYLNVSQAIGAVIGISILWGLSIPAATLMYKYFEVPVTRLRDKL